MKDYKNPREEDLSAFINALRKLDRHAEADAFSEFLARYTAGSPTYEKPPTEDWRKCDGPQVGAKLIRSWGNGGHLPESGRFPIGTLAAKYKIGEDGEIHDIYVLVARHPAAAWLIIDTLAESRISQSRLKRMRLESPESFPVELCAWWDYNDVKRRIPPGNRIRGL